MRDQIKKQHPYSLLPHRIPLGHAPQWRASPERACFKAMSTLSCSCCGASAGLGGAGASPLAPSAASGGVIEGSPSACLSSTERDSIPASNSTPSIVQTPCPDRHDRHNTTNPTAVCVSVCSSQIETTCVCFVSSSSHHQLDQYIYKTQPENCVYHDLLACVDMYMDG